MTPRKNNRQALIDGALTCLETRGYADTRARDITEAGGANLASIGYHFGTTEALLGEALAEGFQRWRMELAREFDLTSNDAPALRIRRVAAGLRTSLERHRGLALAFLEAAARAPRSDSLAALMSKGYEESRRGVAALLDLGDDETALHTAALVIATFDGLLIQMVLDPDRAPRDSDLGVAVARLGQLAAAASRAGQETSA